MPRPRVLVLVAMALAVLGCAAAVVRAADDRARVATATTTAPTTATTSTTTTTTTTTAPPATTETTAPSTTAARPVTPSTDAPPETAAEPPPALAAPAPVVPAPAPGDGSSVLMIGDSVMVGATPYLVALPGWSVTVDATVSRQFGYPYSGTGVQAVHAHADDGTLGARVVIHLGTNGRIRQDDFDEVMAVLANVPRVVFVTVRIPAYPDIEAENNELLFTNVARYPNMVVADWHGLAAAHPSWFDNDPQGVHPTAEGQQAYADLIGSKL
jgi:hypothetical protein